MRYKKLHDGFEVPVLGLGTATYGSGGEAEVRAIQIALDLGYTHIDTAENYGGGGAEQLIGSAIKGRDRSRLFITSKVSQMHLQYEQVLHAIEGSLRRLDTDYLDLYLIHWPNPAVPLEETFRALNRLVEEGKTRYIGVSNFNVEQMERSFRLTSSILATNQVHYSLFYRDPEENGVLRYCQEHDVLLTAYTPVEHGRVGESERVSNLAAAKDATTAQIALAWLIAKPSVITIPQSKNEAHLRENLGALAVQLDDEDMNLLDTLVRRPAVQRR